MLQAARVFVYDILMTAEGDEARVLPCLAAALDAWPEAVPTLTSEEDASGSGSGSNAHVRALHLVLRRMCSDALTADRCVFQLRHACVRASGTVCSAAACRLIIALASLHVTGTGRLEMRRTVIKSRVTSWRCACGSWVDSSGAGRMQPMRMTARLVLGLHCITLLSSTMWGSHGQQHYELREPSCDVIQPCPGQEFSDHGVSTQLQVQSAHAATPC